MALALPDFEQVIFDESPLEEVVCQLRFNPILRIATMVPADFQERIRKQFPVFAEERGLQLALAGNQPVFTTTDEPAWQFKTADQTWSTTLTPTFVALRTTAYEDFAGFLTKLGSVVESFEAVYEPPFYVRVGLRYVNRLIRARPASGRVAWEQILNPLLSGMLADPVIGTGIAESKSHLVLEAGRGQIGWRFSRDVGNAEGKAAERFTLDFDHYAAGQVACKDVRSLLAEFNNTIYRIFRWCLTEAGTASLKPRNNIGGTA